MKDLVSARTNLFCKCGREYVALLLGDDEANVLGILSHRFQYLGAECMAIAMRSVLSIVLSLVARVWKELEMFYDSWPYKLVRLVSPQVVGEERAGVEQELCNASQCCLDTDMSLKVQSTAP